MNIPGRKIFHGEDVLSDWQARGGEGLILRGQHIDASTTALKVVVQVWTKNHDDAGDGSPIEKTASTDLVELELIATGTDKNKVKELIIEPDATAGKGIEEMVRLYVSTDGGSSDDQWMLVRFFDIVWFDGAR